MSTPTTQLINGAFQAPDGTPLANGTLVLQLNQDALVGGSPPAQIAGNYPIIIPLNSSGNINSTVHVWNNANDLSPDTTYYLAWLKNSIGIDVWQDAPHVWLIPNVSSVDVGTLPNSPVPTQ